MPGCKPCLFAFFALSLCCTLFAAEPAPPPPVDPMLWTPPKTPPKPREVLKGEEFDKKLAQALAREKAEEEYIKALPKEPCLCFSYVPEESAEYKNGLSSGDIILKVDGMEAKTYEAYHAVRKRDQAQQFTVISRRDGYNLKEVTVKVNAGFQEQIHDFNGMSPAVDYCEFPRDPKWDALIVPAYRLYNTSAEISETLLYRAEKLGYPDGFAKNALLAGVLLRQGLYAQAMDAAWFAMKEKPDFPRAQGAFYQSAAASFKLEEVFKTVEAHPQLLEQEADWKLARIKALTEQWRKIPPEKRAAPFPIETLRNMRWRSWLIKAQRPDDTRLPPHRYERFLTNRTQSFGVPTSCFSIMDFPLPPLSGNNFYLQAEFHYQRTSKDESDWLTHFTLGLFQTEPTEQDVKERFAELGPCLGIQMLGKTPRGRGATSHAISIMHPEPGLNMTLELEERMKCDDEDKSPIHRLEIGVLDGRVEMKLDDKRIYYAPINIGSKKWQLRLSTVGVGYAMHNLSLFEVLKEEEFKKVVQPEIVKPFAAGFTALHDAVSHNLSPGDIKLLLDLGADPNALNRFGESPLHLALRYSEEENTKLLLERGAKKDVWVQAALGEIEAVKAALAKDPGLPQQRKPWPLLHAAVLSKNPELIKLVLDAGANINQIEDFDGHTALCWAIVRDIPSAELLLTRGANPKITDFRGVTVLQYRLDEKVMKMVKDAAAKAPPPPPRQRPQQVEPPKETKPTKPVQPPEEF